MESNADRTKKVRVTEETDLLAPATGGELMRYLADEVERGPLLSEMDVEHLLAIVEVRLLECDPHTDPAAYIEQLQGLRYKLIEIKGLFTEEEQNERDTGGEGRENRGANGTEGAIGR